MEWKKRERKNVLDKKKKERMLQSDRETEREPDRNRKREVSVRVFNSLNRSNFSDHESDKLIDFNS